MEELRYYYQKLLQLLEEEEAELPKCIQGEILEGYRKILRKEKEYVENQLKQLRP